MAHRGARRAVALQTHAGVALALILCLQTQRLRAQLASYPALIDEYQRRETEFPEHAIGWIEAAEKLMAMLQLPDSTELASLRGRILKVEDNLASGEGSTVSRTTIRRARNAAAADSLERAESVLRGRLLGAEERLKQFEDKLCEGMTAFLLQNTLVPQGGGRQEWLLQVWAQFAQFPATRPLSLYLASALAQVDRCFILDNVLQRVATLDRPHPPSD